MRLWAGVSLREGCHASNVIVVSLMTESKQTIAVTLHRAMRG